MSRNSQRPWWTGLRSAIVSLRSSGSRHHRRRSAGRQARPRDPDGVYRLARPGRAVTDDKPGLREQLEAVTGEPIAALEAVKPERAKGRVAGLDADRSTGLDGAA